MFSILLPVLNWGTGAELAEGGGTNVLHQHSLLFFFTLCPQQCLAGFSFP